MTPQRLAPQRPAHGKPRKSGRRCGRLHPRTDGAKRSSSPEQEPADIRTVSELYGVANGLTIRRARGALNLPHVGLDARALKHLDRLDLEARTQLTLEPSTCVSQRFQLILGRRHDQLHHQPGGGCPQPLREKAQAVELATVQIRICFLSSANHRICTGRVEFLYITPV